MQPLRQALQTQSVQWLSTRRMRDELQRVLDYPHIARRLQFYGVTAQQLIDQRDQWTQQIEAAPRCAFICKDCDDQCFIDLAVAHNALLLSKDAQVLKLRKRLAKLGIVISRHFPAQEIVR